MTPHPDWNEDRELPKRWVVAIYLVALVVAIVLAAVVVYLGGLAMEAI